MASEVDISNLALSYLGDEAEVTSIKPPDGTAQAAHCGRFYPMARNELLEMHPWSFAVVRVSLNVIASGAPSEWAFAYALPAKYLRALAILLPDALDDKHGEDFIVESDQDGNGVIYTNVEAATLRYVRLVEDPTKFTPGFTSALARLLASKLAGPILKGATGMQVAQAQLKIFLVELANAKTQDSNSGQRSSYRTRLSSTELARGGVHGGSCVDQYGWVRGA
ncbi:hypothetical protein [Variovorax guangxiensis]|uniref:hypothetical protein n=1 Tax=Variovorax guangxiensis TaxID=1775474 RepID=UPI001980104D|nr:hypothetical protein [Variovorax guangxiensis]